MTRCQARGRAGFSLIETSLSTLLIGVMLMASMRTVGSVLMQRNRTETSFRAQMLGQQLLMEILASEYVDATQTASFGREPGEAATRTSFDDVDDYHQWDESPPKNVSGVAYSDLSGWRRKVTVSYVSPTSPDTVSLTDQQAKRITVEVYENNTLKATVQAVKCSGWARK